MAVITIQPHITLLHTHTDIIIRTKPLPSEQDMFCSVSDKGEYNSSQSYGKEKIISENEIIFFLRKVLTIKNVLVIV